jgi:hypothetical protein
MRNQLIRFFEKTCGIIIDTCMEVAVLGNIVFLRATMSV